MRKYKHNKMKNNIKVGKPELSSFEELKFPDIVYKYREANHTLHRTIITEQTVFFSSPNSFEDELDCRVPIRFDLLTDDEIYDFCYQLLKEFNPTWDSIYLRDQALRFSNVGLFRDKKMSEDFEKNYWNELNERLGILCLTADPGNISMWRKYAKNLNGFCVGFDPKIMFTAIGGGGEVSYFETLPVIKPSDSIEFKISVRTYSKLRKWAFEKEYRTQIFRDFPLTATERKVKIPNSAFIELIIGEKVKAEIQKEIIKQAHLINPEITIKIASIHNGQVVIS